MKSAYDLATPAKVGRFEFYCPHKPEKQYLVDMGDVKVFVLNKGPGNEVTVCLPFYIRCPHCHKIHSIVPSYTKDKRKGKLARSDRSRR